VDEVSRGVSGKDVTEDAGGHAMFQSMGDHF
jgi:hypothetical protein